MATKTVDVRLVAENEAALRVAIHLLAECVQQTATAAGIQGMALNMHAPRSGRRDGWLSYGTLVFPMGDEGDAL
jgi:hypothetical protein